MHFEPTELRLEPHQSKQIELIINVDKNAPSSLYDLQIIGTWKEEGKIPDFMGSSIRLHVGRDFGVQKIPVNMLSPPLKIWKESQNEENFTINDVQCRNDYVLVVRASNGNPACVKPETRQKLIQRGWAEGTISFAGKILDELRKGPQEVSSEQVTFIRGLVMLNDTVSEFLKERNWDSTCCAYITEESDNHTKYSIGIDFFDRASQKQLLAVFDLDTLQVTDISIGNMTFHQPLSLGVR